MVGSMVQLEREAAQIANQDRQWSLLDRISASSLLGSGKHNTCSPLIYAMLCYAMLYSLNVYNMFVISASRAASHTCVFFGISHFLFASR